MCSIFQGNHTRINILKRFLQNLVNRRCQKNLAMFFLAFSFLASMACRTEVKTVKLSENKDQSLKGAKLMLVVCSTAFILLF